MKGLVKEPMEMDNEVGIDFGSRGQAGQRGAKGEIIGTTEKHKNKKRKV